MNRSDELRQREHSLRAIVQAWLDRPDGPDGAEAFNDQLLAMLAETQMLLERHLAETASDQRDIERYYLEFQLSTFTYLRRWYDLSVLGDEEHVARPPRSLTI